MKNTQTDTDIVQLQFQRGNSTTLGLLVDDTEANIGGNVSGGGSASSAGASGGQQVQPEITVAGYTRGDRPELDQELQG